LRFGANIRITGNTPMKHVIAKQKLFSLILFLLVSGTASAADFITFSASNGGFVIS
jgi:hypothetical protein